MLWRVADNAVRDLGWFSELLPALQIHKAHMREQAWRHWATATDLAGALVSQRGLPWRTAHQIVGILVRLCEERGLGPADVTPAAAGRGGRCLPRCARSDSIRRRSAIRSTRGRFIAARTLRGGPAHAESLRQATLFEDATVTDETIVAGIDARLAEAARKLEQAVDAIIANAT